MKVNEGTTPTKLQIADHKKNKESPFLKKSNANESSAPTDEIVNTAEVEAAQNEFIEKQLRDSEVIFKSKCKLWYLSKKTGSFEARGEGDMVIVKDKTGMVKISMSRAQIGRLGCNHYINPRFDLEANKKISNAWVWCTTEDTVDCSDSEGARQIYLVKFSESEDAEKFKKGYTLGKKLNEKIVEEGKKGSEKVNAEKKSDEQ